MIDDAFAGLGAECNNGGVGACGDIGEIRCDPANPERTYCDLSVLPDANPDAPMPELCNNQDDNCDGIVDNSDPDDPERIVEDMVHLVDGGARFLDCSLRVLTT